MYSRSSSCLSKGKVHDLFRTQPRPSAPLDFLYPRWFSQRPATSKSPISGPQSCRDENLEEPSRGQDLRIKRVKTGSRTLWLWAHCLDSEKLICTAESELQELRATVRKRKELARTVEKRLQNRAQGYDWSAEDENIVCPQEILRVRKPNSEQYTPPQKMLKNLLFKGKHERDIVWTVPARILSNAMQLPIQRKKEGMLLREHTLLRLTGTAHENAWIHNSREGCEVHVLPKAPGSNGLREVLLYGSQAARQVTNEYLRAEDEQLHAATGANDEDLERYIRWVPSDADFDPDTPDALRADQMPVPEEWSVKAFAIYVEDLCAMKSTRGLQRELYPGQETLHRNVATVLEQLFTTEELTPYLSSHAFNLALQFTCKRSELGSTTELLYNRAKQAGLHRQIWLFNLMIERALKMKWMDRLADLVKDMLAAGVVPDGMTWSKLLLVSPTTFARRHILDFILQAYSEEFTAVLAHLAQRLVEQEMVRIVRRPDGIQHFLERMDSGFGPDWLTSRTLDKILKTCADHQLWQAADEILDLAAERKIEMLPSTAKALMYLHYQRGNLNAAIDLLQSPRILELGYVSTYAIHWAFLTAWRQQRYNVCRVLWQYAATRGLISHQMQSRVYTSLIRNQHLAALPEHQSWEDAAGKLIIGTDLDTTNFDAQFPRLSRYFSTTKNPLQWLGQWTPNNGTREEQISLAYVMVHRDLKAWKVLKPLSRHDLPELLNAARRKDQAWVLEKFDKHATLAEMLANAIQIPLVATDQHRPGPQVEDHQSMRPLENIEKQTDAESLFGWRPYDEANLSSKMIMWAAPLSNLSLGLSWPVNILIRAVQKCSRIPGLNFLSMWYPLAQRISLQSTHPVV